MKNKIINKSKIIYIYNNNSNIFYILNSNGENKKNSP